MIRQTALLVGKPIVCSTMKLVAMKSAFWTFQSYTWIIKHVYCVQTPIRCATGRSKILGCVLNGRRNVEGKLLMVVTPLSLRGSDDD